MRACNLFPDVKGDNNRATHDPNYAKRGRHQTIPDVTGDTPTTPITQTTEGHHARNPSSLPPPRRKRRRQPPHKRPQLRKTGTHQTIPLRKKRHKPVHTTQITQKGTTPLRHTRQQLPSGSTNRPHRPSDITTPSCVKRDKNRAANDPNYAKRAAPDHLPDHLSDVKGDNNRATNDPNYAGWTANPAKRATVGRSRTALKCEVV